MRSAQALAILEAAYAVGATDREWLAAIAQAAGPAYDLGLGVCAYFTEVGGPGEIRNWGHVGSLWREVHAVYEQTLAAMGPEAMRQLHMMGPFGSTTRLGSMSLDTDRITASMGASTACGVMGLDAEGRGISLATWSPPGRVSPPRPGEARFWARIAPHLATAARLRRGLVVSGTPGAVLEPGGRVGHAEGAAKDRAVRTSLRDATLRIDRARAAGARLEDDEALTLWHCLVERRWTMVDSFESDGRRYVVAYPNQPAPLAIEKLTERERAVAMAAALGHANKMIAYELGIADSTVATLLSRAARKLGVQTRVELVKLLRTSSLGGQDETGR